MAETEGGQVQVQERPVPAADDVKVAGQRLMQAVALKTLHSVSGKMDDLAGRLNGIADSGGTGGKMAVAGAKELAEGKSGLRAGLRAGMVGVKEKAKEKAKETLRAAAGGGQGGRGDARVVNVVEEFDVGLPLRTAYDQWTRFGDYPGFTRKVESVEQESDEKITWRAKIFLSHRNWESTIVEQIPDDRIVWRSKGDKGYVDGAVTFHPLAPNLTRVLLVAEYHPGGFVEKTANLWRAQGRRLRSDFKHIKRHMMTRTVLDQGQVEGWRGEIRDGEVVRSHEEAIEQERRAAEHDHPDDHDRPSQGDGQGDGRGDGEAKKESSRTGDRKGAHTAARSEAGSEKDEAHEGGPSGT